MANIEQFKVLSHITTLQTATTDKIQKNGGRAALVKDMRVNQRPNLTLVTFAR